MSSNAIGTLNDFMQIKEYLKNYNALFLLDAVHYAPHFSIDVNDLGCDFLLCSAYKFYGPHIGLLYANPGLLEKIQPERLVVQDDFAGAQNNLGLVFSAMNNPQDAISCYNKAVEINPNHAGAYNNLGRHEFMLASHLYSELNKLNKITVIGTDFSSLKRTPTVSFVHNEFTANQISQKLAQKNICAWDGHFYALKAIQSLGLEERGGVTRLGISAYNSLDEINLTEESISKI